jgi:hypothetical protein
MCTLCEVSSQDDAKENLGSFAITRTYEETLATSLYLADNPDKLSAASLKTSSKGVSKLPVVKADAREKGIDATHADINMGSFFYKVIVREVANVQSWEATQNLKPMLDDAAAKFDVHIKRTTGLQSSLMMPGNYARQLFDEKNTHHFLALIQDEGRKRLLADILDKFRFVRKLYRSKNPHEDFPDDIPHLKEREESR